MGRDSKFIDLSFFEKYNQTNENARKFWYIVGLFHSCYSPKGNDGIHFFNKDRKLVEIVKHHLDSDHKVTHVKRSSTNEFYKIEAYGAGNIRDCLDDLGMDVAIRQRTFPDYLPGNYLADFARGFIESRVEFLQQNGEMNSSVGFNRGFLSGFNKALSARLGVDFGSPSENEVVNEVVYNSFQSAELGEFMYQDINFLRYHKIYHKEKMELFKAIAEGNTF